MLTPKGIVQVLSLTMDACC